MMRLRHREERIMSTTINQLLAVEHTADLRRAAQRGRSVPRRSGQHTTTIELRLTAPGELEVANRLAELDDAPPLEGQVLLALADGHAVAGLSLQDQRVVANPFVPTGEAVALLRLRAQHLRDDRPRRRLAHRLRLRSA
jgi:hypothetical protein